MTHRFLSNFPIHSSVQTVMRMFGYTGRRAVALAVVLPLMIAACSGGDTVTDPKRDVRDIFWELQFNHVAVTMATGQTLQLTATPLTVEGTPITTLPRPRYVSTDTLMVAVDSLGRLTAIGPGYMASVIATLTSPEDGVTNVDTVFVNVNPDAVTVRTFAIQQPDSANLAVGWWTNVNTDVIDTDNNSVYGLLIHYTSSNPTRAAVDQYASLEPKNVGPVTVYAEATIYGVKFKDSVKYNITYPLESGVSILNTDQSPGTSSPSYFAMPVVHIQKGGTVYWNNSSKNAIDVTFDDPTNVDGGNIESIPPDDGNSRVFPVAGTYHYRSTRWGSTGRVIVH